MSACGCHALGDADQTVEFPRVARVLRDYIADCLRHNRSFYISPELNSDVLAGQDPDELEAGQLGFLQAILAAVVSVASTVGSAAIAAAPAIASIGGTVAAIKTANIANKQLAAQQTQIPSAIAPQVVQAAQDDNILGSGISTNTLLLIGGGLAIALLVSGRR